MSSRHSNIDKVKLELAELFKLDGIDTRRYAAALRYVASNEEEVSEMCESSSISDAVDTVVSIAGSCSNGRCE